MPSTQLDLVGGISTSMALKVPVRCVAAEPLTLSGLQTVMSVNDGLVPLADGDRVLVPYQGDPAQNGIYDVHSGLWVRSADFDGDRDATRGTRVYTLTNRLWRLIAGIPVRIGITALTWVEDDTTREEIAGAFALVTNIAELRGHTTFTLPLTAAFVEGYWTTALHATPDAGGGAFLWDEFDLTSVDDGGLIIVDASGRRWKRQYSGAVHVAWFGAKGDNIAIDTAPITEAAKHPSVAFGGPGTSIYLIDADIDKPVGNLWKGTGKSRTVIKSADGADYHIHVMGEDPDGTTFGDLFEDMQFYSVGPQYGRDVGDFGVGSMINRCLIQHVTDQGVSYRHNCYDLSIVASEIHHCGDGVLYHFTGVTGSGSNLKIRGSHIYNNANGVHFDGVSVDGVHAQFSDVNIEHNENDLLLTDCNDTLTLHMTNVHMELSTVSNITMDGGNVSIDGYWINLDDSLPPEAHFLMSGGSIMLQGLGRVWDGIPMVKNTGTGRLYIEQDKFIYGNLTFEEDSPCAAGDTAGYICISPYQKFSEVPINLTPSVQVELFRMAQSEAGSRVCRGRVTVTAGHDPDGLVRLAINPGGHNMDFTALKTAGVIDFEIHITRTKATIVGKWLTSGAGTDYATTQTVTYAIPPGLGNTLYLFVTAFNSITSKVDYFEVQNVPINTLFTH